MSSGLILTGTVCKAEACSSQKLLSLSVLCWTGLFSSSSRFRFTTTSDSNATAAADEEGESQEEIVEVSLGRAEQ